MGSKRSRTKGKNDIMTSGFETCFSGLKVTKGSNFKCNDSEVVFFLGWEAFSNCCDVS